MTQQPVRSRVVVRGAGEMASGVIRRLATSGFEVIALELPTPICIRRHVCYAEAFFQGKVTIEGVTAVLVKTAEEECAVVGELCVPLLIDPEAEHLSALAPMAVIDGRMLKQETDADLDAGPIVIGLGPGFVAGQNCHAAVETSRGDDLGSVIYSGSPRADTGVPASVNGVSLQRVLRSPTDGEFISCCKITDIVKSGQTLGKVAGVSVVAGIDGIVRGLIHDGLEVSAGQKIGDIDPRFVVEYCYKISDKANAIGRGVLEALTFLKTGYPT